MEHVAKPSSVMDRILTSRSRMPATISKIADLMIEDPQAPLNLSITELATRAGTSASSVTRFCRIIGYEGYLPLRVQVAQEMGRSDDGRATWKAVTGRSLGPDDPPEQIWRTLLDTHVLSLTTTADLMELAAARRVAKAIAATRHLDVYGVGGSALTGLEIEARLYRIGVNVHPWAEVHDALTSAALLDKDCVAIGVSNTGRTEETIQVLSRAKTSGAYTVAMTGNPESPLAKLADEVLIAASPDGYLQPADLSARHCQLLVVDLLYLLVAQINFEKTTRLLAASGAAVASHRRGLKGAAPSVSNAGVASSNRTTEP